MDEPEVSEDEYPSEDELKAIEEWQFLDVPGVSSYDRYLAFMEFIKSMWWAADIGYWTEEEPIYYISTAGWSGNESLISAMQKNFMFWSLCWEQSRKGGHYIFQLPQHESFKEVKHATNE